MKPSKTAPIGFLKGRGDFCGAVWWRWSVGASFKMSPLGIPPPPPPEVLGGESLLESSTDGKMS